MHLEDYKGSYSFYLFSDDYIKFKSYFTIGWILHLTGKVQKKFYNDDLEFKLSSVNLLAEIIDKEVRDVILSIDINDISEENTKQILSLVEDNKGKHSLILNILDHENNYDVNLLSRKCKVNLDNIFFNRLATLNHVKLKIKS